LDKAQTQILYHHLEKDSYKQLGGKRLYTNF